MKSKAASRTKEQESQVAKWNTENKVGAAVSVRLDSGEIKETTTRSEAQMLSGHTAVVWLEGVTGCYLLDRVKAKQEQQA